MTIISKIPIRTVFDANNSPLGLSEFQTGEVVSIEHGGTGANTTANARFNLSVDNVNVRALISVTGSGTYDNTTGVITIQTGAVTSVGGQTGAVSNAQLACSIISSGVLTTGNVGEVTNLYFTNTRAREAISVTGAATYDSSTGVINVTGGVTSVGGATGAVSNAQLASSITSSGLLTTSNVSEGTNQYFTNAKVQTYLQAVGNIYPSGNNIQDLGRPTNRFKDLYLSGNSIYLGTVVLSSSDDGKFAVNSSGTTLNVATSSDLTTANVSEVSNLYFTNARVYANVTALNYATTSYVANQIANLVNSAPSTLDTLNELASALNNDPSFATTTATLIGNSYNQANAAFAAANTKVATVAGVTSTTISNSVIASGISQTGILTTANVTEVNNLYFTNARVYANVESIGYASNLYVNTRLLTKANVADLTTSNVSEGSNLYFTNTRARAAISVTGAATYDNSTGVINVTGGVTSVGGATGAVSNAQLASSITSSGLLTTSNVTEGTNLYFSNARVYANVQSIGYATNSYVNSRFLTADGIKTLTNTTFNVSVSSNNIFSIQGNQISSYSGSGLAVLLDNLPTINGINIGNGSQLTIDGGTGTYYWSGQSGVAQAGDHKAGVYASSPTANNSIFTFGTNGSNNMSVGVEGSLFVGTSLPSNNGGLNTTFPGWLVVQSGGKFGGTINTLGALQFDDALTGKVIFADGTEQNTAFKTSVLTTANVSEVSNLYFTNTRSIGALTGGSGVSIAANGLITSSVVGGVTSVGGATGAVSNAQILAAVQDTGYLTSANITEITNLYFTNTRAISALTEGSGINIDANGLITATVSAGVVNSFNTISVVNGAEGNIIASGSDTLKIETTGLITANTNPSTKTLSFTIGGNFPFFDSTGSQNNIALRVADSTVQSSVSFIYLPFSTSDGTSVNTLRYQ